jgi:small subunit ribosomal protein S13
MVYILEAEISSSKPLKFALQSIYGLGNENVSTLFKTLGLSSNIKLSQLSDLQVKKLLQYIEESDLIVSSELKNLKVFSFKALVEIKAYRGLRKLSGLPSRGQRTHTNSKTAKRFRKFK